VETLTALHRAPPDETGLLGEISVRILPTESECYADPEWWPRVFQDLRGRLVVRARNEREAIALMRVVSNLIRDPRLQNLNAWQQGAIPYNAPHYLELSEDLEANARVVAKIAYGLLRWWLRDAFVANTELEATKAFVRHGGDGELPGWIIELSNVGSFKEWPAHHLALLEADDRQLRAVVCLYGACSVVCLGLTGERLAARLPVVAVSARNGTKTKVLDRVEGERLRASIHQHLREHVDKGSDP
jgi:hypothetical protein